MKTGQVGAGASNGLMDGIKYHQKYHLSFYVSAQNTRFVLFHKEPTYAV